MRVADARCFKLHFKIDDIILQRWTHNCNLTILNNLVDWPCGQEGQFAADSSGTN